MVFLLVHGETANFGMVGGCSPPTGLGWSWPKSLTGRLRILDNASLLVSRITALPAGTLLKATIVLIPCGFAWAKDSQWTPWDIGNPWDVLPAHPGCNKSTQRAAETMREQLLFHVYAGNCSLVIVGHGKLKNFWRFLLEWLSMLLIAYLVIVFMLEGFFTIIRFPTVYHC